MKFLSVCSGIESASVAWNPLGWEALAFSEIEPFPCAVLKHHYPDVPNHGDFTKADWRQYRGAVDLAVAGTPCQDFSIAGLRAGMAGTRGNLTLEFLRVLDDARPRWMVWENVPGLLSVDGGRAFGAFLGGLAQLGYGFAYRVLDAQYFGVAQRRRRVFVVGHLGDWRAAAAVLFEREGLRRDTPPSREAGQGATHDVAPCIGASGRGFERGGDTRGQDPVVACLNGLSEYGAQVPTLRSKGGDCAGGSEALCITGDVTHSLRAEGFDASEDGTGRGQPMVACFGGNNTSGPIDVATARSASGSASGRMDFESETFAVSVALRGRDGGGACEIGDDKACALRASQGGGDKPHVLAFHQNQRAEVTMNDTAGALNKGGGKPGQGYPAIAYSTKLHNTSSNQSGKIYEEYTVGLDVNSPPPALLTAMQVRRLTPRECCRLQGFPDDYTQIPWRGKPAELCPDGPRYKALGNSKAVPVVRWIGKRIEAVEEILRRKA